MKRLHNVSEKDAQVTLTKQQKRDIRRNSLHQEVTPSMSRALIDASDGVSDDNVSQPTKLTKQQKRDLRRKEKAESSPNKVQSIVNSRTPHSFTHSHNTAAATAAASTKFLSL